jgi:peptidyl-prolyl cis-trans isomerase C
MVSDLARAALVSVALGSLPFAVWAQTAADPVVATVNGKEIHRSDVDAARQDLPQQYQSFPFEVVYPPLLERLIDGKLLVAEGRQQGLASDPEVKARLARLEDQVIQNVYLTRAVKAKLTDDVLKARYAELLKSTPPEQEVHARHILTKTEEDAKAVIVELKGGADFVEVAKKRSTGPEAAEGGDLGFIKRGDVVAEFAEAAFALKPGQFTETPVKTQFGWHVIKVEEFRKASPPSFEEAKAELERDASRDTVTEIVNDLRSKAKIVRFNADGSPMKEGEEKPKP